MPTGQFTCKPSEVRGKSSYLPIPACTVPLAGVLQKTEKEVAAAIVVQVCQESGDNWIAVTSIKFEDMLQRYKASNSIIATMHGDILNSLNELAHEGLILIDRDKNPLVITVTPEFVEKIK